MNKFQSEILEFNISILVQKAATKFLKSRDAVVKCKHNGALDELKLASKESKNELAIFCSSFGVDMDSDAIIENFCGFGREWKPNETKVAEFAAEHEISFEQARASLEASMVSAQYHSQTVRGNLAGIYAGWLADVDVTVGHTTDATDKAIKDTLIAGYAKAGEWMNRAEALLIEGAANDLGVILPKWADVLPQATAATKAMQQRVTRNIEKQAEHQAAQYIEAMREIDQNDW